MEKEDVTGNVSYDPANHEHMVHTRAQKIANIANDIPAAGGRRARKRRPAGDRLGRHLRLASLTAVQRCSARALKVAHAHLRYLNPMPKNTGDVLKRFKKVLVPELNSGQLRMLLRANSWSMPSA